MIDKRRDENWRHYSFIWRNILNNVLEWREKEVEQYIEELRQDMESCPGPPAGFGFFFDPPFHYLFRPILGDGLHERIMQCKSEQANPSLIFQRLETAISQNLNHWELEKEDFDWSEARKRYQEERRKIEEWLSTLD